MRVTKAFYLAAALLAAVSLAAPPVVLAQARQSSTLTGKVTDESGAVLPGAAVTVTGSKLIGGARSTTTDVEGVYRFLALPPGSYDVTAELASFRSVRRTDVQLELATTITIDFQLSVAAVAETITVTGESPVVDVKTSSSNTQIDDKILQNLPTGRFQPDVINLAPGVTGGVAFGGSQCSNALLIDGVDVSDPSGGSPWSFFNYNWIGEVQVVSLGANAEYGEFTGVAANSTVRSGSNRFSGLFEYWTVRNSWLGDNTQDLSQALQDRFKPRFIKTRYDSTAQIGGPLVKDKLWFFTGFQYYKNVDRPAGFNGGFTSEKDPRFITKINWAPSDAVRVEGFYEKDKYDVTGRGADTSRPPETTVIEPSPEYNWNGRVTWTINAKTLLDVRNGGYSGYFPLEPTPPNNRQGPSPHFDGLTGLYSVNAPYFARSDRDRNVTAVTLTKYVDQFAGRNHEFKFGLEFERSKLRDEYGHPSGKYYYDYGGAPYLATLWDGYVNSGTGKRTTLYAQDSWTVNDRLTINPGIRFNFNRGSVPQQGTVYSTNPVSPRIGLAFDVTGDHKTVVRAHYGRYHDALLGGTYQFMDLSSNPPIVTALVLAAGGCANGLGPDCQQIDISAPTSQAVDPKITQSYVDQYLIGIERELFPAFSLQVQYIRRNFRNFVGFVDNGSIYDPVQRTDPGADGVVGTPDDGGLLTVFNLRNPGESQPFLTNPDGAFRDYDAFQIIGRKRYSDNWQMNGSYTWSKSKGTVSSFFFANAGGGGGSSQEGTGQGGIFYDPNRRLNQNGNSAFDYTQQVKLESTYRLPFWGGFNISGIYRYTTGLAWGRRVSIRDLDQGSELVRVEPRGTRRTPAINRLDFRLEKTFEIGSAERTAGVFLDWFNLTNQGVIDNESRTGVIETSGTRFGQPNVWVDPRLLRLGLRFTF